MQNSPLEPCNRKLRGKFGLDKGAEHFETSPLELCHSELRGKTEKLGHAKFPPTALQSQVEGEV